MKYIHHVPGRMRIRCGALKGNPVAAAAARGMLAAQTGVESVDVNTVTGSILIRYSGSADPEQLVEVLRKHGYSRSCHPVVAPALHSETSFAANPRTPELGNVIAKTLVSFAVEKAVERSVLALAAALL